MGSHLPPQSLAGVWGGETSCPDGLSVIDWDETVICSRGAVWVLAETSMTQQGRWNAGATEGRLLWLEQLTGMHSLWILFVDAKRGKGTEAAY